MSEIATLLSLQTTTCNYIFNFLKNTKQKKSPTLQTAHYFEARLALLERYWSQFLERHEKIYEFRKEHEKHDYFARDAYNLAETAYVDAVAELRGDIEELRGPKVNLDRSIQPTAQIDSPSIPKVTLPTFSGKQDEWESFKQRFSALIKDNAQISEVTKLQHLLNAVQGPAAARLSSIEVVAANFQGAWDMLTRRYDNPRIRLSKQLEKLIQLPSVHSRNVRDLNALLDQAEEAVRVLMDLECPVKHYDNWLVHCIVRKLDSPTREQWQITQENTTGFANYKDLVSFLERRIQSFEQAQNITDTQELSSTPNKYVKSKWGKTKSASVHAASASNATKPPYCCILCKGQHYLYACEKFKKFPRSQRIDFSKRNQLCSNCLSSFHKVETCASPRRCFRCKGNHHTLLHFDSTAETTSTSLKSPQPPSESCIATLASMNRATLLATARVIFMDKFNNAINGRALIDPGAERSFITTRLASLLKLPKRKASVSISGVGAQAVTTASHEVSLVLRSSRDNSFTLSCSALVLPKLTGLLPSRHVTEAQWPHLRGIDLADPDYLKPDRIDFILGADLYADILRDGLIRGPQHAPIGQNTVFGWVITGPITWSPQSSETPTISSFHVKLEPSISQTLIKFWEVENIPCSSPLTPEEEFCEHYFKSTFFRNADGRYVVRLPFSKQELFPDSRDIAVANFLRSEKRRVSNAPLNSAYKEFMQEYKDLTHMEPATPITSTSRCYYLPHHAVFRTEPVKKIRVVFNASQRCGNGLSLNDLLLPGPKLQLDLTLVLTRWRFHQFVLVTDIVKMFRQIELHPEDRDWVRLVWRDAPHQPVQDFRACTVTYGTACAPFLALRTLAQLAEDGQSTYPDAAQLLRTQVYVDDIFIGGDSVDQAIMRRDQVIQLLNTAGMPLGKWSSNTPELLQQLPSEEVVTMPVNNGEIVSILGLNWCASSDSLMFKATELPPANIVTKRLILSHIAKLFDPLGFLAPVLISAKLMLQDLWIHDLDWDTPLQDDLLQRWVDFRTSLPMVAQIKLPRWTKHSSGTPWQLHGFSDASKRAYAAVVYAVIPGSHSIILMAKTKVAPIKVETLPRLELCGAVLLTRLAHHVYAGCHYQPQSVHLWTDSKIVLDWLNAHPSRWPTFIANRVSEIISTLPSAIWRHVKSADNPADCASRGLSPHDLSILQLWWEGPPWITKDVSQWPQYDHTHTSVANVNNDCATQEVEQCLYAKPTCDPQNDCLPSLQKFSNISKVIRILSYIARWLITIRQKNKCRQVTYISAEEWKTARLLLLRAIQRCHFRNEMTCLQTGKSLPLSSCLASLSPFIGSQGLLRVGGRLQNAPISLDEKHPVILPGRNVFVKRLVEEAHYATLHGGASLLSSFLRRHLWIIRGKRLINEVCRNCVTCTRYRARPLNQQMAPLPEDRVTPQRPFNCIGIDFAGPFDLRFSKGRGAKSIKGYVLVIVCLVIKAVHLEVVSDLTTQAFLAAFSRFTARRGQCSVVYSDNGTTFKGAATELKALFDERSAFIQGIASCLAQRGIEWRFIPPRAPHFGGLWESAVKSFKYHLKRVVGESKLTYEEMSTLIAKIEACLNSRPLCPISNDANDLVPLTPGHFLTGTCLVTLPEPPQDLKSASTFKSRWQMIQHMHQSFWARWRLEVLHHLHQRSKWLRTTDNIEKDDIVLLVNEPAPPSHWPLGRVSAIFPGKDGLTRVAEVKTSSTTLTRPIVKLIKLPVDHQVEDVYCNILRLQA